MLKPYPQRPSSSFLAEHSKASCSSAYNTNTSQSSNPKKLLGLKQMLVVTKGMREQLETMRRSVCSFEAIVPNQYRSFLQSDKENVSGNNGKSKSPGGKLHLCETKAGSSLKDLSPASRNPLKSIIQEKNIQNPPLPLTKERSENIRETILKELRDLRGLEKKENIVRCINDSRSRYSSRPGSKPRQP